MPDRLWYACEDCRTCHPGQGPDIPLYVCPNCSGTAVVPVPADLVDEFAAVSRGLALVRMPVERRRRGRAKSPRKIDGA